jgi:hypothetical protein
MRSLNAPLMTRRMRLGGTAVTAVGAMALAATVMATAAGASGGTLGTVKTSGEIAGSFTVAQTTTGPDGIPIQGCQVGQESTQLLVNMPSTKVTLNGKPLTTKVASIVVGVTKNGNSEQITSTGSAGVELQITTGGQNYNWAATSGTVSTKAKGDGGSFNVTMAPAGQGSGDSLEAGKATMPAKMNGSFSSCHPFHD